MLELFLASCSKNRIALAISSQHRVDPDLILPPDSFCSIDEGDSRENVCVCVLDVCTLRGHWSVYNFVMPVCSCVASEATTEIGGQFPCIEVPYTFLLVKRR